MKPKSRVSLWLVPLALLAIIFIRNSFHWAPQSSALVQSDALGREAFRKLSDLTANDILFSNSDAIYANSEIKLQESVGKSQIKEIIDKLFNVYGTPSGFEFKSDSVGTVQYLSGESKPMRKFWYAVDTSKHKKGTVFLFVQIVTENNKPAVNAFSFVTFLAGVPPELR